MQLGIEISDFFIKIVLTTHLSIKHDIHVTIHPVYKMKGNQNWQIQPTFKNPSPVQNSAHQNQFLALNLNP